LAIRAILIGLTSPPTATNAKKEDMNAKKRRIVYMIGGVSTKMKVYVHAIKS